MQTINQIDPLRHAVTALRRDGPIALVPTMGALHDGHLSLVREAKLRAVHVVVSIFVNPLQFGAGEDLAAYPRQLARDAEQLEREGVALLWAPPVEVMFPEDFATQIAISGISEDLEGTVRPGHFDGVATVVAKLFNQVRPDLALFGEKDWQQLAVVRRMARDLDLTRPHADAVLGVATRRDPDGVAMSSRNAYLSDGERAQAAALPHAMHTAIERIGDGTAVADALEDLCQSLLAGGFSSVDYAELRDAEKFELLDRLGARPARLLVAARLGRTRLIDNMPVG